MSNLAIFGGDPVLRKPLPPYVSMGEKEKAALRRVIDSGCLSGFYGSWGDQYFGGPEVIKFEEEWAQKFSVKFAVTVNSATSGLQAALGAVGIGPGDEVIVPPFTMSATCITPLVYGGIPVFADIEPETFCISLESVKKNITSKTKAIIAVNLFGHPARLHELKRLCDEKNIFLIEDNAQSPTAMEKGVYAGTIGHVGVFSLNYHKHIHTGEGGVCVTNSKDLATRMQMIRNHGENVTQELGVTDITNMVGYNLRLTEMSAAIGRAQLENIEDHVQERVELAEYLSQELKDLPGIEVPQVRKECSHVYYLWAPKLNPEIVGVSREAFSRALEAEGFPHSVGYVKPLYMLPIFQQRKAIGSQGFPFNLTDRTYKEGLCPVAEDLHKRALLFFEPCAYQTTQESRKLLAQAFIKVYEGRKELK